MSDRYHHGNLPDALRASAAEVIAEKGVGGFSLREVARRAGVSHAAPAHHFGDTTGLLTSLAAEGLDTLHEETAAAAAGVDDPVDRLVAIGRAYVDVALRFPAHFEVAFRDDLVSRDDAELQFCGLQAYGVLEDCVRAVAEAVNPDLDVDVAAKLCWSAMQGLIVLSSKMEAMDEVHGRTARARDELIVRFTHLLVDGFRAR